MYFSNSILQFNKVKQLSNVNKPMTPSDMAEHPVNFKPSCQSDNICPDGQWVCPLWVHCGATETWENQGGLKASAARILCKRPLTHWRQVIQGVALKKQPGCHHRKKWEGGGGEEAGDCPRQ